MLSIVFGFFVVVVVASMFGEIAMRVQLRDKLSRKERDWMKDRREDLAEVYRKLFPNSPLPLIRAITYWLVLAEAAGLAIMLLKAH